MENVIITFVTMLLLLALSCPVGVSIGAATILGLYLSDMNLMLAAQRMFQLYDSFPLLAVPFFILAGEIMARGTLAGELVSMCKTLVGHKRGGLALVTIFTCMFYAALCGSALATTAAVGAIMIPAMIEDRYEKNFSIAASVCAGTLGPVIPPSINLILYGSLASVAVPDLFIAGIGPGLLLTLVFCAAAYIISVRNNYGTIKEPTSAKQRLQAIWAAKWALGVPVIVLGCIYGGLATPTEAGAGAVLYAIFVEFVITKSMTLKTLWTCLTATLNTMGMVFIITMTANALGILVQFHHVTDALTTFMLTYVPNKYVFMLALFILLLVLGMLMEVTSLIIILVPIMVPLAHGYGIDLVHFAQFLLISIQMGLLTPPVGVNLYVGCSIGDTNLMALSKACIPYLISYIICVFLIAVFPQISLCLL